MYADVLDLLACPVCHAHLKAQGNMLKCPGAHSFDCAKEGYVNLLLKSAPGDTKEMLTARRNFLGRGFYRPLSDAINELIAAQVQPFSSALHILDAGCGEGYYLARLQTHLATRQPHRAISALGLDSSKEAIRMAARRRRHKDTLFAVANLKERLTVLDSAIDILLNIFAPHNPSEFARVLAPGGLLLIVIPGEQHLLQLRAALPLLSIERNKQQHVIEQCAPYFDVLASSTLAYDIALSREEIELAVLMTPNYWHRSQQLYEAMQLLDAIETTVDFTCLLLRHSLNP